MLEIIVPPSEDFDEVTSEFIPRKGQTLKLEHSLISLSKWESFWNKPFLNRNEKTDEESIDYIRCMIIGQPIEKEIHKRLTKSDHDEIAKYINLPMTATTFPKNENRTINREIITSEIIYYWMVAFNIPFECEMWHLNRLLTLINVCNVKNQPSKKMKSKDVMASNRHLNAARRSRMNSRG